MHPNIDSIKGKKFELNSFNNCYNCIKDFYKLHGLILKSDYSEELIDILEYIENKKIFNIINNLNFKEVNLNEIKYGDLILFENKNVFNSKLPFHLGVYLDKNDFFHMRKISCVDFLNEEYINCIIKIYRNKDFQWKS